MIHYAVGDPVDRADGLIVAIDGVLSWSELVCDTESRVLNWMTMQEVNGSAKLTLVAPGAIKTLYQATRRLGDVVVHHALFEHNPTLGSVYFAVDRHGSEHADIMQIDQMYEKVAKNALKSGVKQINVPLLGEDGPLDPARVASAAWKAFNKIDVEATLFLPAPLMRKISSKS